MKFQPYEKGGGDRKCFSHAEGGGGGLKQFWGSFYTSVLAILKGGTKVSTL